jgi:hypothetical protein
MHAQLVLLLTYSMALTDSGVKVDAASRANKGLYKLRRKLDTSNLQKDNAIIHLIVRLINPLSLNTSIKE